MKYFKSLKKISVQDQKNLSYSGVSNLIISEVGLRNYNNYLVSSFATEIKVSNASVLDFGAGTGTLAEIFRNKYSIVPDCVEIDPELQIILNDRKFKVHSNLESVTSAYDFIYSSNVMEHIPADSQTLKNLSTLLRPGGRIVIHVPAFPILYSSLDINLGHVRRYKKRILLQMLEETDLTLKEIRYDDVLGFFVVFFLKFSGLMFRLSAKSNNDSKALRIYDTVIFPASRLLDRIGFNRIIGKNLIVVAEK